MNTPSIDPPTPQPSTTSATNHDPVIDTPSPTGTPGYAVFRVPPCGAPLAHGGTCRFAARRDTGLCINHDPAYREQQRQNIARATAASLQARAAMPLRLDDLDLSSRAGVQAALDVVARLEIAGRIPPARARNLARLLSIASRNFGGPLGRRGLFGTDRDRYEDSRHRLLARLEATCRLADARDAARHPRQ